MTYTPSPIDIRDVRLPPQLEPLAEKLAEHVHDLWAEGRLAEGWKYGPGRDDVARTHPGLVPYAELADDEKAYDRRTAVGTLRAILALGFSIAGPDSER